MEEERKEKELLKAKLYESEARAKHLENILEAKDKDLGRLREVSGETNSLKKLISFIVFYHN